MKLSLLMAQLNAAALTLGDPDVQILIPTGPWWTIVEVAVLGEKIAIIGSDVSIEIPRKGA